MEYSGTGEASTPHEMSESTQALSDGRGGAIVSRPSPAGASSLPSAAEACVAEGARLVAFFAGALFLMAGAEPSAALLGIALFVRGSCFFVRGLLCLWPDGGGRNSSGLGTLPVAEESHAIAREEGSGVEGCGSSCGSGGGGGDGARGGGSGASECFIYRLATHSSASPSSYVTSKVPSARTAVITPVNHLVPAGPRELARKRALMRLPFVGSQGTLGAARLPAWSLCDDCAHKNVECGWLGSDPKVASDTCTGSRWVATASVGLHPMLAASRDSVMRCAMSGYAGSGLRLPFLFVLVDKIRIPSNSYSSYKTISPNLLSTDSSAPCDIEVEEWLAQRGAAVQQLLSVAASTTR